MSLPILIKYVLQIKEIHFILIFSFSQRVTGFIDFCF